MSGTTSTYNLPYQDADDPPNGPTLGQALAEAVEAQLQRIDTALTRAGSTLVNTPDSTFPKDANATTSEGVANRITLPAVGYARSLQIHAHTLARYSQANNRVSAMLYVNGTRVDTHTQMMVVNNVDESFKLDASYLLPASTAAVIEVRFIRVSGTGLVTSQTTDAVLSVVHRAA